jgi:murein DD-endopeptidase MepM/ murein hydrolase activator NlpD
MPDYQILLLPRADYWSWVEAAKPYAIRFGVNVTSDPNEAGRYMAPQQAVTVAGLPDGYPGEGDIRDWFRSNYPQTRLDYVPARSAAEFQQALQARVAANSRYLVVGEGIHLRWPTDFAIVNQGFGEHVEIYRRWGLPGHDGLDIFAPKGGQVYACADGKVKRVDTSSGDSSARPAGTRLTIEHADSYESIYGHLGEAKVAPGDVVRAGQLIALIGNGADDNGGGLYLALKKAGATAAGQTLYPDDHIDPTPFLEWPSTAVGTEPDRQYPWAPGYCLVGLHGRTDGPLQPADYPAIALARIEAVKLLSSARPQDVNTLRAQNARVFVLMRMFASFEGRVVRAQEFAAWMAADLAPFYSNGLRYFEIHNEPNLVPEGWTHSWNTGQEFGAWFIEVRNRLKQTFPEGLFGFPGLSPGDSIPGLRLAALEFLTGADAACRMADWIGLHQYWLSDQELNSAAGGLGYLEYRRRFPDKLLFITEFSNPAPDVDKHLKGQQYVRLYQMLRTVPGLGAAFSFAVSASSGFGAETWRNEDGSLTEIPGVVGARSDTVTGLPPPPP